MVRVLGIDPGVTGAWALVDAEPDGSRRPALLSIGDLPVRSFQRNRRLAARIDPVACGDLLDRLVTESSPDKIVVEQLKGAPGIATTTAFSLGWTGAVLDTLLATRNLHYLSPAPSTWKRALRVPADKGGSRRWATALFGSDSGWPQASHHNRAEAALLAFWGALTK